MLKRSSIIFIVLLLVIGLAFSYNLYAHEGNYGGMLRVAVVDDPPTLDQQVTTSDLSSMIAHHIFEKLYTFDSSGEPKPSLVESDEVLDDGELIVIKLRENVMFHNGKEMTSSDVIASLERWFENGVRGPILGNNVDKVVDIDDYTIEMHFEQPFAAFRSLLANPTGGASILPSEIMNEAGAAPIEPENYIGTGPYEFNEWRGGNYISVVRFDDYAARSENPDGYFGTKTAYFDEIRFYAVPESGTRELGLKSGEYDFSHNMPGDLYESLSQDDNIKILLEEGPNIEMPHLDLSEGLFTDLKLRQAALAAIDPESLLMAGHGPEDLWVVSSSFFPEGSIWYVEESPLYNQTNIEKAQRLLEEANYDGEEVVFMTTTSYDTMYDISVVMANQLSQAGFNVNLQIYDWATLTERRENPDLWDIYYTWHGFVPDPMLLGLIPDDHRGGWDSENKKEIRERISTSINLEERQEAWAEFQHLIYEEIPVIQIGLAYDYSIASNDLAGIDESRSIWPHFWNAWFDN